MKTNPRYFVLLVPLLLVFFLCFTYAVRAEDLPPEGDIENALSTETPDSPVDTLPGESSDLDGSPAPIESPLPDVPLMEPTSEPSEEPSPEPTMEPVPIPSPEPTIFEKPFAEYTTTEGLLFCLLVLGFLALVVTLFVH